MSTERIKNTIFLSFTLLINITFSNAIAVTLPTDGGDGGDWSSCDPNPCEYGQKCYEDPFSVNGHVCRNDCDAGYICPEGTRCVSYTVYCIRSPCPPIVYCESVDPCASNPCRAGQKCYEDPAAYGGYMCANDCDAGYECPVGTLCVEKDVECFREPCPPVVSCKSPCSPDPCPGGQKCYEDIFAENGYICANDCDAGYQCPFGTVCEENSVTCKRAPCPPRVSCVNPCEYARCPYGQSCLYNPYKERKFSCHDDCDPDPRAHCGINERCVETEVPCFAIPCPPFVSCEGLREDIES